MITGRERYSPGLLKPHGGRIVERAFGRRRHRPARSLRGTAPFRSEFAAVFCTCPRTGEVRYKPLKSRNMGQRRQCSAAALFLVLGCAFPSALILWKRATYLFASALRRRCGEGSRASARIVPREERLLSVPFVLHAMMIADKNPASMESSLRRTSGAKGWRNDAYVHFETTNVL